MNSYRHAVYISCIVLSLTVVKSEENGDGEYPRGQSNCVCKPTMRIEMMDREKDRPICNNETVSWLLNTALERITKQSDWIGEILQEMKTLEEDLGKGHDLLMASEKLVKELEAERAQSRSELKEKNERIQELELKLRLAREENRHFAMKALEGLKDYYDSEEVKWRHSRQNAVRPRDCSDVQESGMKYSGIYSVYPDSLLPDGIEVFCDLNTDGGRWTVIQRRQDGSESFERSWKEYKKGFGVLAKEFWLGNDNIHSVTSQDSYSLRIDMIDYNSTDYFAVYDDFTISGESDKYRLSIGEYLHGNAGDSLTSHGGWPFSTIEADNDGSRSGNCSELYGGGGWWFARCYDANLNGRYEADDGAKTIVWYQLVPKIGLQSMRSTEMKIRPQRRSA